MWFLLLISLLLCASCAGREASGTANIAQNATGDQPPSAAELDWLLTAELARLAAADRQASGVAWGEDCRALYSTAEYQGANWPVPPDRLVITWVEQFTGDCDMDGMVTAADLTPIAQHWLERVEYDPPELHDGISWWPSGDPLGEGALNWRLARIDGNHDGLIDIGDITPIAQHWNQRIEGYSIYSYDDFKFNGNGSDRFFLGMVQRAASLLDSGQGPRIHRVEFEVSFLSMNEDLHLESADSAWSYAVNGYQSVLPASLYLRPVAEYSGGFDDWWIGQGSLPLTLENPCPAWQVLLWLERDGESVRTYTIDLALATDGSLVELLSCYTPYDEPAQYGLALLDPVDGAMQCFVWPASTSFYPRHVSPAADGTIWVAAIDECDYAASLLLLRLDKEGNLLAGVRLFREDEDGLRVHCDPQLAALPDGGVLIASAEGGYRGDLVLRRFDAQGSVLWEHAWTEQYYPSSSFYGFEVNALRVAQDGSILVGGTYCPIGGTQDLPGLASFDQAGELLWIRMFDELHSHSVSEIVETPDGRFACVLWAGSYGPEYNAASRLAGITPDGELAWQLTPAAHVRLLDAGVAADGTIWAAGSIEAESGGIKTALLRLNSDGSAATLYRRLYPCAVPEKYVTGDIDELELGSSMFIAAGGHANAYDWEGSELETLAPVLQLSETGCRETEVSSMHEEYSISLSAAEPSGPPAESSWWTAVTERVF